MEKEQNGGGRQQWSERSETRDGYGYLANVLCDYSGLNGAISSVGLAWWCWSALVPLAKDLR